MDNPVTAGGETGRIDQILIGLTQINIAYIYSEDISLWRIMLLELLIENIYRHTYGDS